MLRLSVAAALLAVRCSAMAVLSPDRRSPISEAARPDPMSMQRGEASANSSIYKEMAAMNAAADAVMTNLKAQVAECKKQQESDRRISGSANPTIFNRPWSKDMNLVRDSKAWGTKPPIRDPTVEFPTKMVFLMFANDRIDNEDLWLHWMEEGRKAGLTFGMHIHAYGLPPRGNAQWKSEKFKEYLMPTQARTVWCQMWEAQMMLLERAIVDSRATHFVMLSSDSVPVKPMAWIYNKTQEQPLSRFCVDDYWRDPWPRAETWSMLRRTDAMFFVENREFAENHFRRDCEEEVAWYFPLRARWSNFNEKAAVKRECIMFTNWKDGEKACKEAWAENAETCNCPTLRKSNSTPANFKHPVVYNDVGADAYEELVRSPFWFARKFTAGALPAELATVMDIDITKPKKKRKRFGIFR